MKRITEKVKDLVEVRSFTSLPDFAADPALTLAGYHFTDITADLMAKWIDRVSSVKPGQGAAMALAGFRGVGKSHFMGVMAAIISRPELRSKILDQHVQASAERLSRRHGPVAFVRRGIGTSLLDELKRAVAQVLDVDADTLSDSLSELLLKASDHAGEMSLVLLVDTAPGRESRVDRDDGPLLSEIAETAKTLGIFVGVALDDDISGADGPNSSIAGNYNIDYLDQEHLYKIVDSHIFSKHPQMLPVLRDVYEYYRDVLPGFRWSEQRFSSLYPLHPATLEIAPLIRLYIHDFALLGFASEAGERILGRPANSLIGLDEVFDAVEKKLRGVKELKETFAGFDMLDQEVVSKVPVQFRLPAKLILKGLLTLSLNGQGSTPSEIAASMMIFDEHSAGLATLDVAKLLDSFADALPDSIEKSERDNAETKYCFKLTSVDDPGDILADGLKNVSDDTMWSVLLRQAAEKFSDVDISSDFGRYPTSCSVEWRGGIRRGELVWSGRQEDNDAHGKGFDWTVFIEREHSRAAVDESPDVCQNMVWRLSELTADEKNTIRRHHLLQTDINVRQQFGDGLLTAVHVSSIAVDKIWQRVFLYDGALLAGKEEYRFSDEAHSAHSLAQLFTIMLAPVFESRYPSHPEFSQVLGMKQASSLVAGFFSGSGTNSAETQSLAETFAMPLGLAAKQGDSYIPVSSESLLDLLISKSVGEGTELESDHVIPLSDISSRLQAPPVGLTREAQHLILATLVAHRRIEFVTSSGNRINHRSLDLQIIWDDIVGVARPSGEAYSPERLLSWAQLLTGNTDLRSIDRPDDKSLIVNSLTDWLSDWRQERVLAEFDALPDENLNAAIWRTAANLRKSFGTMAQSIDELIGNTLSIDQCIQALADTFSDSEDEYEKKKSDLRVLRDFINGVSRRADIAKYLSLCEMTGEPETESARLELLTVVCGDHLPISGSANEQIEVLWARFKDLYSHCFAAKHDAVMASGANLEVLKEILTSDAWTSFEDFSTIPWFDGRYLSRAKSLVREIRQLHCDAEPRVALETKPFCSCSFSLAEFDRLSSLPAQLQETVQRGIQSLNGKLDEGGKKLADSADSDAARANIRQILSVMGKSDGSSQLTSQDIRLLKLAIENEPFDQSLNDDLSDLLPNSPLEWDKAVEGLEVFANSDR